MCNEQIETWIDLQCPKDDIKFIDLIPHAIQYNSLGYDFNCIFKEQIRALRIVTCSKYNADTDPIFKTLKLMKIRDTFNVQNLKI